jgi:hypothetical protein
MYFDTSVSSKRSRPELEDKGGTASNGGEEPNGYVCGKPPAGDNKSVSYNKPGSYSIHGKSNL